MRDTSLVPPYLLSPPSLPPSIPPSLPFSLSFSNYPPLLFSALQFMDGELKRLRFIRNQTEPYPTQYMSRDQSRTPPPRHTPSPPRHTPSPPLTTVSPNPQRDYRPLTRKRWLETSEGGLIFGTPPQAQPTQSPPLKNTGTCSLKFYVIAYLIFLPIQFLNCQP